jgi:hypothetical protein
VVYSGPVVDDTARPFPLSGFWSMLVGGAAIVALLVFLSPMTSRSDCPNALGNGNASAFADPRWDLYLPLVLLGWILLIVVEQFLPVSHRGRTRSVAALRGVAALALSVTVSCCLFLQVATVCR